MTLRYQAESQRPLERGAALGARLGLDLSRATYFDDDARFLIYALFDRDPAQLIIAKAILEL